MSAFTNDFQNCFERASTTFWSRVYFRVTHSRAFWIFYPATVIYFVTWPEPWTRHASVKVTKWCQLCVRSSEYGKDEKHLTIRKYIMHTSFYHYLLFHYLASYHETTLLSKNWSNWFYAHLKWVWNNVNIYKPYVVNIHHLQETQKSKYNLQT